MWEALGGTNLGGIFILVILVVVIGVIWADWHKSRRS